MIAVMITRAMVSATVAGRPGNQPCSAGLRAAASVAPPKAAERKPARVTPICTADRKRLGFSFSRATVRPREPRWASCLTWLSRSETRAISAPANTPPTQMNSRMRAMLRTSSEVIVGWSRCRRRGSHLRNRSELCRRLRLDGHMSADRPVPRRGPRPGRPGGRGAAAGPPGGRHPGDHRAVPRPGDDPVDHGAHSGRRLRRGRGPGLPEHDPVRLGGRWPVRLGDRAARRRGPGAGAVRRQHRPAPARARALLGRLRSAPGGAGTPGDDGGAAPRP